MKWCSVDENGMISMCGECPDSTPIDAFSHVAGDVIFNAPVDVAVGTHYVSDGVFVPFTLQPSTVHVWDWDTHSWVRSAALAVSEAKAKRAELLAQSDWTQLPDVPLATKDAWATYRQALRDITTQPGYPTSIDWPVAP